MDEEKKDESLRNTRPGWMAIAVLSSGKRKSGLFLSHEGFVQFAIPILQEDPDAIIWYAVPSPMKVSDEARAEWRANLSRNQGDSPK